MNGYLLPSLIRNGRGRTRRLKPWYSLNRPTQTVRRVASAPELPERTSSRYCLASQGEIRSGAARSNSVA